MRRYLAFFILACWVSLISACGQSGNLYLPYDYSRNNA